jgi:hypothetical protein
MLAYRLPEAGEALERALHLARELEATAMQPGIVTILGWTLIERGRAEEALPLVSDAVERAAAIRQHYVEPGALAILASAQLALGHGVQARAAAERGLALARTYGQRWTEVEALLVRGAVAAGDSPPDLVAAEARTREARTLAEALTIRPALVRADLQLGRVLHAAGRPADGAEAVARACALASRLGMDLPGLSVQPGTPELTGA